MEGGCSTGGGRGTGGGGEEDEKSKMVRRTVRGREQVFDGRKSNTVVSRCPSVYVRQLYSDRAAATIVPKKTLLGIRQ